MSGGRGLFAATFDIIPFLIWPALAAETLYREGKLATAEIGGRPGFCGLAGIIELSMNFASPALHTWGNIARQEAGRALQSAAPGYEAAILAFVSGTEVLPATGDYTGALAALDAFLNWTSRADVSAAFASQSRLQYLRAGAWYSAGKWALAGEDWKRAVNCAQEGLFIVWSMAEPAPELESELWVILGEAQQCAGQMDAARTAWANAIAAFTAAENQGRLPSDIAQQARKQLRQLLAEHSVTAPRIDADALAEQQRVWAETTPAMQALFANVTTAELDSWRRIARNADTE